MEAAGAARQAIVRDGDDSTRISVLVALRDSPERAVLMELLEAFGDEARLEVASRQIARSCADVELRVSPAPGCDRVGLL